jgi:hypothetical protein
MGFSSSAGWSGLGQQSKLDSARADPWVQKNFTSRVTARVKNRVKHTFFLQTLKNSLNFLIIFFFQQ